MPIPLTCPEGKVFIGWKTEDGINVISGTPYNFDKNIVLKAIFGEEKFTVTIRNETVVNFTDWADGTIGDKIVEIDIGGKIYMPKINYDDMTAQEKNNETYKFSGWYYKNKSGENKILDTETTFTLENLNLDKYEITVFAKVSKQWIGDD